MLAGAPQIDRQIDRQLRNPSICPSASRVHDALAWQQSRERKRKIVNKKKMNNRGGEERRGEERENKICRHRESELWCALLYLF